MTTFLTSAFCLLMVQGQGEDLATRLRKDTTGVVSELYQKEGDGPNQALIEAWPKLDPATKKKVAREVCSRQPARCVAVADLAIRDADFFVQSAGLSGLEGATGLPLAHDYHRTLDWLQKNRRRSIEEIRQESRTLMMHELKDGKGAALDESVARFTDTSNVSFRTNTWPAQTRKEIFDKLTGMASSHSGMDARRYRDVASAVGLDEETLRREYVPRWYETQDPDLCAQISTMVWKTPAAWSTDEALRELRFIADHPKDTVRVNAVFPISQKLGPMEDSRAIEPAVRAVTSAGGVFADNFLTSMLSEITGLRRSSRYTSDWWAKWWTKNKSRFQDPTPPPPTSSDEAKAAIALDLVRKAPPESRLSTAKSQWPSLTIGTKGKLIGEWVAASPDNLVALLEFPLLDADLRVQEKALGALSTLAIRPMDEDYPAAKEWGANHRETKTSAVIVESARELRTRLLAMPPTAMIAEIAEMQELYPMGRLTTLWSQAERDDLFVRVVDTMRANYGDDGVQNTALEFAAQLKPTSELVKARTLPGLEKPEAQSLYRMSLFFARRIAEPWSQEVLFQQVKLLADAPKGPRGTYITDYTLALMDQSDPRLVPLYIRLMIEGPGEWAYWVDWFGLHRLTKVEYNATLHNRAWWRDWWYENRSHYPGSETVEMPPLPKEQKVMPDGTAIVAPKPTDSFEALSEKFRRAVDAGDLLDQGMSDWPPLLIQSDPLKSVPWLVSALVATGDDAAYNIGYFHLSRLVGVDYNSGLTSDWWRHWWALNRDRLPSVLRTLPELRPFHSVAPTTPPHTEELRQTMSPVRSIAPDGDSFRDLEPLKKAIGSARIVQFGEPSHQDGASFFAKTRVIRFLHEKCGFDVLLWESGLFDGDRMDRSYRQADPSDKSIELGIFPIWAQTPIVQSLSSYVAKTYKTNRPLISSGVDPQFSGQASRQFAAMVESFFSLGGSPLDAEAQRQLAKVQTFLDGDKAVTDAKTARSILEGLIRQAASARGALVAKHGATAVDDMVRYLENAAIFADLNGTGSDPNLRDRRMAENLAWLANGRYRGKKIIVWAASYHLMHNAPSIDTQSPTIDYSKLFNMGQGVHETFGKDVYTLAFVAARGAMGNPFFGTHVLERAPTGSIEDVMHATSQPYGFLDFRSLPKDSWLRTPRVARPLGYSPMKAVWPNVFDGFFFTDVMFPSTNAKIPPYAMPLRGSTARGERRR